ncbi:hypothetical protein [Actinomadura decatromicini]|uniref:Uncharacterized protein n=1 Tax=Actinomadura decatromicini TaxID=2604572 RepID=A0A5D3FS31_9ACTN|nr:hypothetical protein [Actinomadura decatromicini]TYK50822.1 hypothetical protein FXF68_10135 [Actinomadura decatromicini]
MLDGLCELGLAPVDVPAEQGVLQGSPCGKEPRGLGLPPLGVPAAQDLSQEAVGVGPDALAVEQALSLAHADEDAVFLGPGGLTPPDLLIWQGESSTGLFRHGSRFGLLWPIGFFGLVRLFGPCVFGRAFTAPDPVPGKPTTVRIVRRGVLAALPIA